MAPNTQHRGCREASILKTPHQTQMEFQIVQIHRMVDFGVGWGRPNASLLLTSISSSATQYSGFVCAPSLTFGWPWLSMGTYTSLRPVRCSHCDFDAWLRIAFHKTLYFCVRIIFVFISSVTAYKPDQVKNKIHNRNHKNELVFLI